MKRAVIFANIIATILNGYGLWRSYILVCEVLEDKRLYQESHAADQAKVLEAQEEIADLRNRLFAYEAPPAPGSLDETAAPIVDLPEDAEHWFATLFVADDWEQRPAHKRAVEMWQNEKWCRDLQRRAHGRLYKISDPAAKQYWPHIKGTPCLMIQDPKGLVVYSETNPDLGKRPRQLLCSINGTMRRRRHCPDNFCPFIPPDKSNPEDEQDEPERPKDLGATPIVPPVAKPNNGALILGVFGLAAVVPFALVGFAVRAGSFGVRAVRAAHGQ